jgi:hypothetical protein
MEERLLIDEAGGESPAVRQWYAKGGIDQVIDRGQCPLGPELAQFRPANLLEQRSGLSPLPDQGTLHVTSHRRHYIACFDGRIRLGADHQLVERVQHVADRGVSMSPRFGAESGHRHRDPIPA